MWSLGYVQVPEDDEKQKNESFKQQDKLLPSIPSSSEIKKESKNNSDSDSESIQDDESPSQQESVDVKYPSEETDNSTKAAELDEDFVIVDPNSLNENNKINENLALKPSNFA